MPRINIEDQLYNDMRFKQLELAVGVIMAQGLIVHAFKMAQQFWCKEGQEKSLIPEKLFNSTKEMVTLIDVGLAEIRENGVYICGSEDQFDWVLKSKENGKKGGRPKATITQTKPMGYNQVTKNTENEQKTEPEITLNLNLNLQSQKKREGLTPADVGQLWNEKLVPHGFKHALFSIAPTKYNHFYFITDELQKANKTWLDYFEEIVNIEKLHGKDFTYFIDDSRFSSIMNKSYEKTEPEIDVEKSFGSL